MDPQDLLLEEAESIALEGGVEGSCDAEVQKAKSSCGEKLAYQRKIHESHCGDKEIAGLLARIRSNHRKVKAQQDAMHRAETALRQVKYSEHGLIHSANKARHNVVVALARQIRAKNGLNKDEKSVLNELRNEKSWRSKAHRATLAAISLAKVSKTMAPVDSKASKAKGLYARMVNEKVKEARAKYAAGRGKKKLGLDKNAVKKLLKIAKKARVRALGASKKITTAKKKVAKLNTKVSKTGLHAAKLEEKSSVKVKTAYIKKAKKTKKAAKAGLKKLKAAQKNLKAAEKESSKAKLMLTKTKGLDLKALLAKAGHILKKGHTAA